MSKPSSSNSPPWLSFVKLSIVMALVPGFLIGAGMLSVSAALTANAGDPQWYAGARQAHGHAQLIGWGGAMILGVGLYFLPRIRGSKRSADPVVMPLFWLFTAGMTLRVLAPLVTPLVPTMPSGGPVTAVVAGMWLETVGAVGLMAIMVWLLRDGPPLNKKKAFAEMMPMLSVAGVSFILSIIVWSIGSATLLTGAGTGPVLPPAFDSLAVNLASFGFLPAISIGMSARVFPLFFRIPIANQRLLKASAALLAAGVAAILFRGLVSDSAIISGLALLFPAAGMALGTIAVRVFEPRLKFPGDRGAYSTWKEPAALGAVSAYVWAVAASVTLLLGGLARWGIKLTPGSVSHDLALHTVGAGFMTLLILGVAPAMLPGFGGSKPAEAGRSFVWAAVISGNVAVLLRVVPLAARTFTGSSSAAASWTTSAFAFAGLAGAIAVACIAVQLWLSLRPTPKPNRP